jgi:hypothetical protein
VDAKGICVARRQGKLHGRSFLFLLFVLFNKGVCVGPHALVHLFHIHVWNSFKPFHYSPIIIFWYFFSLPGPCRLFPCLSHPPSPILDNDMVNGTKLLNVAGMSRGKRDGILKNEKGRVVVKVGAMHLKGVW